LTLPKKVYQTLNFSSKIIVNFLKLLIIAYTLYLLFTLGFFDKATEAFLLIRRGRRSKVFYDMKDEIMNGYKKFDGGKHSDLPDLPFELLISKKKPKIQKIKIKVPIWLSYVFLHRTFLYSFINKDSLSKVTDFFPSKGADPKEVDKLVESIIKELQKLDRK
jgi:hypothetical protein